MKTNSLEERVTNVLFDATKDGGRVNKQMTEAMAKFCRAYARSEVEKALDKALEMTSHYPMGSIKQAILNQEAEND